MKVFNIKVWIVSFLVFSACVFMIETNLQAAKSSKADLYYCPMHPQITSDKPGECPICYMKLVKRKEDMKDDASAKHQHIDHKLPEGYESIILDETKRQMIGVTTTKVEHRKLIKTIRTAATVAHDPELYQAQVEFIQAIKALNQAQESSVKEIVAQSQRLVDSSTLRLKHMGLSDEVIEEMKTWKEAEHSLIVAHQGGPIWVYAQVYEYELPLIKIGQEVKVDIPALPNEVFTGKIRAIDPMVEIMTRTTRIRAQVMDLEAKLRPDMYVNVVVQIDLGEPLAIPFEAVLDTGNRKIVFVDLGNGKLEPRDVKVGVKAQDYYVLEEGVHEGENVVVSGNFLIDSESRLKASLEKATTQSGHGGH